MAGLHYWIANTNMLASLLERWLPVNAVAEELGEPRADHFILRAHFVCEPVLLASHFR